MRRVILALPAVLMAAGTLSSARAQEAASGGALEEVVVTAQRRTEDVEKTAIPISVISSEQIAQKGQTELDEVLRDTPSVQIQSSPQGADIVIRGVGGNDTGGISQDPDVSVFNDGVYSGQAATNLASVYDVERIEVLRGPQGTLYGRNSAGGDVNIISNSPTNTFGVGANANYGNLDFRHFDGYVNMPLSDQLALRVAVDRELREGYYSNDGGALDNTGLRVKLEWKPNDNLTLRARYDYWRQAGLTETTVPVGDIVGPCGPPCFLFMSTNPGNPWNTAVPPGSPFAVDPVYNANHFNTYSLQVDWNLGFGVLTLLPAYTDQTQQQSTASLFAPAAPPFSISTTTGTQTTIEARLSSPANSAIKWVAGVYTLKANNNEYGVPPGGTAETFYATQSNNRRPASSYAGFAQLTYPFSDALRGTLGARYTVDEKSIFYGVCSSTDGLTCGPSATGAGSYVSPAGNVTDRYTSFTYKAGLEYDLTPTTMGYAQISTGYKAGGFSTATASPVAYAPEHLYDYELGLKSRLLDNQLEINADVYLYQYHDQQIELHPLLPWTGIIPIQYVPAAYLPGGSIAATTPYQPIVDVNGGNSRYEGLELQATYQFTARDQVRLEAAYNHAVYGSLVVDTTGGPPGTAYSSPDFDLSGQQEAHAPLWNGSLAYQHIWDVAGGTLTFNGRSRLQTRSYTTIQEWFANGQTIQPGYHVTDLDLRFTSADGHWSAGPWVKNLENKAVVTYVYPLYKETLDIGRTYGVNVSLKY